MIRTDSPTETLTRFLVGRYPFIHGTAAREMGSAKYDFAVVFKVLARMAGVRRTPDDNRRRGRVATDVATVAVTDFLVA